MRSILFLDIDGVLNSKEYFDRVGRGLGLARMEEMVHNLDIEKVEILNEIIDRTGADIVLISTWKTLGLTWVNDALQQQGFEYMIDEEAPSLDEDKRGEEIMEYLSKMDEQPCSFAVVDDVVQWYEGIDALRGRVVETTWENGLTRGDAEEICMLLGGTSY